ncbi:MAG: alpha/beta hydrolase [Ruminococcaceae bacterium]|nr:alpha/beta hydrolase [Oscillospiraceae bacterium]
MSDTPKYRREELHCKYNGTDIFGRLYIPEKGEKPFPAVICSPGYGCIGSSMKDIAVTLAENGILAYAFDFCGNSPYSKSSGNSTELSILTLQDNLRHVIDMIGALDIADRERIHLCGESQGGFVSALTAAEMPQRIAGMFLIYPAFCIPDQWLAMDPAAMTEPFSFMGDMMLSKAYYDGVPRYDVYEHISAFDKPVFIYHGDADGLVDLSYGKRVNEAFPNSTLTVINGGGHGFEEKDRNFVVNDIVGFFTK